MSWLPEYPNDGNIHVTVIFLVDISNPPSSLLGAPHFAVLDQFYPEANVKIATALNVDVADMEIVMVEKMKYSPNFMFSVTVRVPGCQKHTCGVSVGQKLNEASVASKIQKALGLDWITVTRSTTNAVRIMDHAGDKIPLEDLIPTNNNEADPIIRIHVQASTPKVLVQVLLLELSLAFQWSS